MNLKPICLLLMIVLASLGLPADLNTELAGRYKNWDHAYGKHDVGALDRMLARNFRIVTGSGKIISRKQYIAGLRKSVAPKLYSTKLLRAQRHGNKAYAWTEERSQDKGRPLNTHRYRDTWTRLDGRWLLLESRTLDEH